MRNNNKDEKNKVILNHKSIETHKTVNDTDNNRNQHNNNDNSNTHNNTNNDRTGTET